MFGVWFYNSHTKKAVAAFGSLFNNIYVLHRDGNQVLNQVKVPLSYGPRRKFIERIAQMGLGEDQERQVAIKLPRMSFEIVAFNHEPEFQLPKTTNISCLIPASENGTKRTHIYTGVPYSLSFQLSIYAKHQDEILQVLEQILPYFKPQYTLAIKPFDGYDMSVDSPVTLTGIAPLDDYEGAVEQRRSIIYTLDFEMKVIFYGPTQQASNIIRAVNGEIRDMDGTKIETVRVLPDPIDVSPDSDYGFTTQIILAADSDSA